MGWKLGSPDEKTIMVRIRMPESMKLWLDGKRGGLSAYVRKLVEQKMQKRGSAR